MSCDPDCGITRGRVGVFHTSHCIPAFQVIEAMEVRLREKDEEIAKREELIKDLKAEIFDLERADPYE